MHPVDFELQTYRTQHVLEVLNRTCRICNVHHVVDHSMGSDGRAQEGPLHVVRWQHQCIIA